MIIKRNYNEDNSDKDRYLLSYADLITLLLGLFIILYSSSQVDGAKYKEFTQAFKEVFEPSTGGVLEGGLGVLEGSVKPVPLPIKGKTRRNIKEVSEFATNSLKFLIENGNLRLRSEKNLLTLELPEQLLFENAKAQIKNKGSMVLDTIAKVLAELPNHITIDGHTDTDPIKTFRYESNWHLSVARATNVAYALMGYGLSQENISIRGYGSQKPLGSNITTEQKARNRRVEITISELKETTPTREGYKSETKIATDKK